MSLGMMAYGCAAGDFYAWVFGVPLVSAFVSRTASDLEAGVVAVRSPFVEALFRKDALGSESPVEPDFLYLNWKFATLKAELLARGLPTCRQKSVVIERLEASDREKDAAPVPPLNLDAAAVVELVSTSEESEKRKCLTEGLSWPHIICPADCRIPVGFNGYSRAPGGWKLNAPVRTIGWRLSKDLALSDSPGYEPLLDRKNYGVHDPILECDVLPDFPLPGLRARSFRGRGSLSRALSRSLSGGDERHASFYQERKGGRKKGKRSLPLLLDIILILMDIGQLLQLVRQPVLLVARVFRL